MSKNSKKYLSFNIDNFDDNFNEHIDGCKHIICYIDELYELIYSIDVNKIESERVKKYKDKFKKISVCYICHYCPELDTFVFFNELFLRVNKVASCNAVGYTVPPYANIRRLNYAMYRNDLIREYQRSKYERKRNNKNNR